MASVNRFLRPRQVQISNTVGASGKNGDWQRHASSSGESSSWISTTVTSYSADDGPFASFAADTAVAGNYTVTLSTPGCTQDNSCSMRGTVNVTCWENSTVLATMLIDQTSGADRDDRLYQGFIAEGSGGDRKSFTVILQAAEDQQFPIDMVAQSATFDGNFTSGTEGPAQPSSASESNTSATGAPSASPSGMVAGQSPSSSSNTLSSGAIAGIVIGAAAVLLVAIIAFFWFRRNGRKTSTATDPLPDPGTDVKSDKPELHSQSHVAETSGESRDVHEMPGGALDVHEVAYGGPGARVYEADTDGRGDMPPPLRVVGR